MSNYIKDAKVTLDNGLIIRIRSKEDPPQGLVIFVTTTENPGSYRDPNTFAAEFEGDDKIVIAAEDLAAYLFRAAEYQM